MRRIQCMQAEHLHDSDGPRYTDGGPGEPQLLRLEMTEQDPCLDVRHRNIVAVILPNQRMAIQRIPSH